MDIQVKKLIAITGTIGFASGWCACRLYDIRKKKNHRKARKLRRRTIDANLAAPEEPTSPIVLPEEEQLKMDIQEMNTIIDHEDYDKVDHTDEEERKPARRPYLIDDDEYNDNDIYRKRELTLYLDDGVVTDEEDQEVNNWKALVGVEALRQIEALGERVVFVRNEETFEDFMITACEGSYGGGDDDD